MAVVELLDSGTPDTTIAEEGTASLDSLIRQGVGIEPVISFARTADGPIQWIQLLHNFDQTDSPGWSFLAPVKIQMQKCDKCAREFCSTINYRRHIRLHRRSLNFHKEPQKYKDTLGAFWDKLDYNEAKEIMSFKDVNLEEVPGSSIVNDIAANLRKSSFLSLPQLYVKAGSALVDIIKGRSSILPVSSQELFSVLEEASERTFLCAGTAESLKKFVFDGEAGKVGTEMKNLIACTSFLVEQKLVKAWLADKDAEALRCQKLLVEEEEAAQKRQADLLERKRQRKIRQKEQRTRDQFDGMKLELDSASEIYGSVLSAESSRPQISLVIDPIVPDVNITTSLDPVQSSSYEEAIDRSESLVNEQQEMNNSSQHFISRWQVPKSQRNGHRSYQSGNLSKWEQPHKHKEQRVYNHGKIWTKKPKPENDVSSSEHNDASNQTAVNSCQLMIGSISVTVRNSTGQHHVHRPTVEIQESKNTEVETNCVKNIPKSSDVKLWRAVHETRGQVADENKSQILKEDAASARKVDQTLSTESFHLLCELNVNDEGTNDCSQLTDGNKSQILEEDAASAREVDQTVRTESFHLSCELLNVNDEGANDCSQLADGNKSQISEEDAASARDVDQTLSTESFHLSCELNVNDEGTNGCSKQTKSGGKLMPFSVDAAKDFLSQRWKEAVSGDHVELVLASAPERPEVQSDQEASEGQPGGIDSSVHANVQPKFRTKPKSMKTRYIPKQRPIY